MNKRGWVGLLIICLCVLWGAASGFTAEKVTLEMWSHWGGETLKMRFVEETIRAFEAAQPEIRIKLHWVPKSRIQQALQASLPKGEGPDIFYAEPYPFQAQIWVQGGYLLDLRDRIDWRRFEPSAYKSWEYPDGGIYGIPLEVGEFALYYNTALFADAGIAVPAAGRFTTAEFLAVVQTLRAKGVIPIAVGNQDRGNAANSLLHALLIRFAGAEKLESLLKGEISWTDADIAAAFAYMKQLLEAGVFPEEMNRLKYQEGYALFVQGKAAMYTDGTWFFGKIADENGNLPAGLQGKLGAMDYPTVAGGKGNETIERFVGGSYVIRKTSPHAAEAVKFLDFLSSPENALLWVKYTQSPCGVKVGFAEHVAHPFLQEFFKSRRAVSAVLPGLWTLLRPEEFKLWQRDLGIAFMGGSLSVAEILQRLATAAGNEP